MKQALKKAGINDPACVTKLAIIGKLEYDDCLYIREKMDKTLQELDLSMSLVINDESLYFGDCSCLTSVILPDSVYVIHSRAFRDCTHLTSIIIPDSVKVICDGAFMGCSSLSSVNIPNSVVSIGFCAFMYCTSLTSMTIPSSVVHIDASAFSDCPAFFTVHPDNPVFQSFNGEIYFYRESLCRDL